MMQKGSLRNVLALLIGLTAPAQAVLAQTAIPPGPQARPGAVQALFDAGPAAVIGGRGPYVDAHGNPVVVPAGYNAACAGDGCGPSAEGAYGACGDPYCDPCNPHGMMGHGQRHYGLAERIFDRIAYACLGGDQRGPHYFDIRAEAVWLERDETFGRDIAFTSLNVASLITGPNVVLSSNDLEYDEEPGFRIVGRYDICPLSVFEFGYMGVFGFESEASFTDPDPVDADTGNLFSLFSDFGLNPATVAIEGGPMPQTERSLRHSISMESQLQSAELSYRRYWVGYIPRVSGTLLAGFRYTRLNEEFNFNTIGEAELDYTTETDNHFAGFQAGGDVWISLAQGMRIGAEGKAGIYNNHLSVDTAIVPTPFVAGPPTLFEEFDENKVAFIGEFSADIVIDLLPSWSLRAGYEAMWLNSLALAGENFNTASPFGLPGQTPRVPFLADDGEALYHGWHLGTEYVW